MCPIERVMCSNSGLDTPEQVKRKLLFKNIGKEKLYVKFKYNGPRYNPIHEWFDCRNPLNGTGYFENTEVKIETSIFEPVRFGCNMTIWYDQTVSDIIFHDVSNTTWNTFTRVYGTFDHSILLQVSSVRV